MKQYNTKAYLHQEIFAKIGSGVPVVNLQYVCVCVNVYVFGYNLVPDFHPNFAATIGRSPDIANRIRTNFLTATGNTFHHQEARR
jgi:hypothetical protein